MTAGHLIWACAYTKDSTIISPTIKNLIFIICKFLIFKTTDSSAARWRIIHLMVSGAFGSGSPAPTLHKNKTSFPVLIEFLLRNQVRRLSGAVNWGIKRSALILFFNCEPGGRPKPWKILGRAYIWDLDFQI